MMHFTFFFGYCHLSEFSTRNQCTIPICKTVGGWINISTVDELLWMACYFILVITIWIYFINVIIIFFSPHLIFFNVIFQKLISTFIFDLISMHLTWAVLRIQIYIFHNQKSCCDDYSSLLPEEAYIFIMKSLQLIDNLIHIFH